MDERRIGRFRILGQHGQGAMGLILRGQDEALGRTAAIKLLTPQRLTDPEAVARFRREAQAVALLKHDHIAALYEFADDGEEPYLAMEWVEGVTLQSKIVLGRLGLGQAVQFLGQMLSALDYAHAQGVVHRDIKPSNLMVSTDSRITLVDFGLACVLAQPSLSATGPIFGTPLYMAPEIASGETVDGRADLYSAALVFFEMLTGKPPFGPGTVAQIISQQINAPRPILSEHVAGLPVALDGVLLKALDRQPERRYPTGQSFLEAVRGACGPVVVGSSPGRPLKWLGVALVALAAGAFFRTSTPPPGPSPTATSKPGLVTPAAVSRLQWRIEAAGLRSMASIGAGLVVCRENQLEVVEPFSGKVRWSSPRQGAPWLVYELDAALLILSRDDLDCLRMSDGKKAWHKKLPEPALASVLSDDEELFILSSAHLLALDPRTKLQDWRVDCKSPLLSVKPVANKAAVFVATQGPMIRAFEADTGRQVWHCKVPAQPTCLALTAHGLVVGCQDGQVGCYSLIDGRDRWGGANEQSASVLGIHGGEDQVVVTCTNGELAAYDSDGTRQWQYPLGESPAGAALTDEERVLVATKAGRLLCLDAVRGRELWSATLGEACQGQPVLTETQIFVPLKSGLAAFKIAP